MPRRHSLFVGLMLATATSALSLPVQGDPPTGSIRPQPALRQIPSPPAVLARDLARLPLSFESNQGQTDAKVRFLSHTGNNTLFLTPSEAVFAMSAQPRPQKRIRLNGSAAPSSAGIIKGIALRMQMIASNPRATALEQQSLPGQVNYLLGSDPSKWHTGVPTFGRVGFHGVYPGVDVVYYGNQRRLEYDFVVAPHADPLQIKLSFAGAQRVRIDMAGDLVVRVQGQELTWQKPRVYQQSATGKQLVAAHYQLRRMPNGQESVGFALGRYDTALSLTIDPVLTYSTFLGGSTSNGDSGNAVALDSSGNAYIAGRTSATNFPTTLGALQLLNKATTSGHTTAFVTKINAAGTGLVYSTYLGGSTSEGANGIAIDSSGNAYVTGETNSTDFPVTTGAFQTAKGAVGTAIAFVTKLNSTGTKLIYSTFLGGTGQDVAVGIAIDSNGDAYVTGSTLSTNFPVTTGALQTTKKGGINTHDAFVTELNAAGTKLIYSTYLGGSKDDSTSGIAIDSNGNAYITGYVASTDFPTTTGAFQPTIKGAASQNAFVTKLNATGTHLVYSSYLGGSTSDGATGIAIDSNGDAYVTGYTQSADFYTTPGAFQRVKKTGTTANTAFVTKLNAAGTAVLYSTYLGGSNIDGAAGIAIDNNGNVYVTGYTYSVDFPTSRGAFQRIKKGPTNSENAFVTKLNSTGTGLVYSTFLGGSNIDNTSGITIDNNGNAYVTGYAISNDFPVTLGAFQTTRPNTGDLSSVSFVTKLPTAPIFPDFNNDGKVDLLIQNSSTDQIASWFMNGPTWTGGAYFSQTPTGFALVGAGDFSGNGGTTLVLQSRTTNQVALWYTSGSNIATISGGSFVTQTPAAGWKVVGVADFNQDGLSDLLFQNQTTNQIAIWFMNGSLYTAGALLPTTAPAGWSVVGAGDINGDGFPDIVFQNQTTGQIAIWYMEGPNFAGGTTLTTVPAAGWKVVGVGDYNGDGSADLLFQNQTTNQAMVWYLNGGVFQSAANLSLNPPTGWKIVGPR